MSGNKVLVTGAAGFIGFHLSMRLVNEGYEVVGLDSINNYYDPQIKIDRLEVLGIAKKSIAYNKLIQSDKHSNFSFIQLQLEDKEKLDTLFQSCHFDKVCNLAAQAGVRYSLENPQAYIDSNIIGFINILEACRHYKVKNLAYASSSSVYGLNKKLPFSTKDNVDHPISLYAASKKSNELMAHTYSNLFGMATTGLRFFTVYGPWGRPDMALFLFTKAILAGEPIDVYNNGEMIRDFTYVDDIVSGIYKVLENPAVPNKDWSGLNPSPDSSLSPYKIYNIGNSSPVKLMDFISAIEEKLGIEAKKNFMELQPGDVPETYADVTDLVQNLGYQPQTNVATGISNFIDWYRDYFNA
ncbi:NAD-dependent epimerase [Ekhidna sp.]|jgi:UDP-glucuronate 4-epimerase|uniref:NAD-dependent epimerase n=1 Tax=Ekhidna sp. TaxID=2608089 RepID=UPI0032ED0077